MSGQSKKAAQPGPLPQEKPEDATPPVDPAVIGQADAPSDEGADTEVPAEAEEEAAPVAISAVVNNGKATSAFTIMHQGCTISYQDKQKVTADAILRKTLDDIAAPVTWDEEA